MKVFRKEIQTDECNRINNLIYFQTTPSLMFPSDQTSFQSVYPTQKQISPTTVRYASTTGSVVDYLTYFLFTERDKSHTRPNLS